MKLDGKSLERATELIEKHILIDIERSKICEIKIETNKIVIQNGVRHELDVFVSVDLKIGTPLIYIFECKNWSKKTVSKNDIIIFNKKIADTQAQKGYFIARKYSSYAENQAKEYDRITLLPLESNTEFDIDNFMQMKSTYINNINATFKASPFIQKSKNFLHYKVVMENHQIMTIAELVSKKIMKIHSKENDIRIKKLIKKQFIWTFQLVYSNIYVDNQLVANLVLDVNVELCHSNPVLIFDYSIAEKGRYIKIKMKDFTGQKDMIMEITKIDNHYKFDEIIFQ